jgi:hypothetical protein
MATIVYVKLVEIQKLKRRRANLWQIVIIAKNVKEL